MQTQTNNVSLDQIRAVIDEALTLWECPICPTKGKEFSLVIETGGDVNKFIDETLAHIIVSHTIDAEAWFKGHDLGDLYLPLLDEYNTVPTEPVVEAVEPEPVAEPVKTQKIQEPCICGYLPKNGKDAGVHKRGCAAWKHRNDVTNVVPEPKPEPELVVEEAVSTAMPMPNGMPAVTLEVLYALADSLDAFLGLGKQAQDKWADFLQKEREKKIKAREFYEAISMVVAKVQKAKELQVKFQALPASMWTPELNAEMTERISVLEAMLGIFMMDEQYILGESSKQELDEEEKTARMNAELEARKTNDRSYALLQEAIEQVQRNANLRFERLYDGRLRLPRRAGGVILALDEMARRVNGAIGRRKDKSIEQAKMEAISGFMKAVGLSDPIRGVTINAPRATVDPRTLQVNVRNEKWHGEASVPCQMIFSKLYTASVVLYTEYKKAERRGEKPTAEELLELPEVQKRLGVVIQPQEEVDWSTIVGPATKEDDVASWLSQDMVNALSSLENKGEVDDPGPRNGERLDFDMPKRDNRKGKKGGKKGRK